MIGGLLNNCHFGNLGANGSWEERCQEGERGLEVKISMVLFIRARSKKQDGWTDQEAEHLQQTATGHAGRRLVHSEVPLPIYTG